jgi:hypothetical protein
MHWEKDKWRRKNSLQLANDFMYDPMKIVYVVKTASDIDVLENIQEKAGPSLR